MCVCVCVFAIRAGRVPASCLFRDNNPDKIAHIAIAQRQGRRRLATFSGEDNVGHHPAVVTQRAQ